MDSTFVSHRMEEGGVQGHQPSDRCKLSISSSSGLCDFNTTLPDTSTRSTIIMAGNVRLARGGGGNIPSRITSAVSVPHSFPVVTAKVQHVHSMVKYIGEAAWAERSYALEKKSVVECPPPIHCPGSSLCPSYRLQSYA